jgi:pimeloyl-ACP methyl ester carboxylesterase
MRQQVQSVAVSKASPDAIWAVAGDFLTPWHPAIATMAAEAGQVRAFTVAGEGKTYRERLTYLSNSDRTYAYTHVEGIEGVHRYDARLTVSEGQSGGSVIKMSADLSAPAGRAEEIASGTQAIFDDGVTTLAKLVEATSPTAAVARASGTSPIETLLLDDLPQLALSVTPPKPGPLCLFLHGIGGARTNWAAQLPAAGAVTQAAALDLRGYGDSTLGADQTTIDDYCADILRIREALGADKLILCGLSYGSWIATSFAMRHPNLLSGLILSGGCTGMSEAGPDERDAFRLSRETPLNAGQTPADFASAVVDVIAGPDADETARNDLHASMSAIPTATYRDALTCFTNPLERFDFTKLTMPVLMMTGEHDRLAPPAEIRTVAGRIYDSASRPDVQFEVIGNAGHVCNLEAPDPYNRHLIAFLKRLA